MDKFTAFVVSYPARLVLSLCNTSTESDEERAPDAEEEEVEDDEMSEEESLQSVSEEMSGSDIGSKDVSVGQLIAKAKAQQVKDRASNLVSAHFVYTSRNHVSPS